MNNENLKDSVKGVIKANGTKAITGDVLQSTLLTIINHFGSGSIYMGFAVPTTNPTNTDVNMFYLAKTPGTYTNFGGYVLGPSKVVVFSNKTGSWVADEFIVVKSIQSVVKTGSVGLVDTYTITYTDGTTTTFQVTNGGGNKTAFDSADNVYGATMKATFDASAVLTDKAFLDRGGDGSIVTLGRDTLFTNTSTSPSGTVYINNVTPAVSDGYVTEISLNLPVANPKTFVIIEKTGPTSYKTIDVFDVFGLTSGVNTVTINKRIPKNCILGIVYNNTSNGYTPGTAGWSYTGFSGFGMAVIGATSSSGVNSVGYLPYTYKIKYDSMPFNTAINILKKSQILQAADKIYYMEDYGGVALDPLNPDAGPDNTSVIQGIINKFFADTTTMNGVIYLRGMYKISGDLQTVTGSGGNRRAQIQLPRIAFSSTNMKIKTLSIISDISPVWEEQGIIEIPTQYGGAGFYSTLYSQTIPSNGANFIFSAGIGVDATLFGGFNNVNLYMHNITFLNRTHDGSGVHVKNTMGALDVRYNSNFNFGDILCKTTTPLTRSQAPDPNTFGLLLPARNNHATVIGRYARVMGYGIGLWATEHLQLELYLGAANGVGLFCERSYQISINTITLEMSPIPVQMGHASILNALVYQSERVLDGSKWYANVTGKDFVQSNQGQEGAPTPTSSVFVASYIVHNEGGSPVRGAWDTGVNMRIIHDEFKQSYLPIPQYGTVGSLPTNPVNGLMGMVGNDLYVYTTSWKKTTLT